MVDSSSASSSSVSSSSSFPYKYTFLSLCVRVCDFGSFHIECAYILYRLCNLPSLSRLRKAKATREEKTWEIRAPLLEREKKKEGKSNTITSNGNVITSIWPSLFRTPILFCSQSLSLFSGTFLCTLNVWLDFHIHFLLTSNVQQIASENVRSIKTWRLSKLDISKLVALNKWQIDNRKTINSNYSQPEPDDWTNHSFRFKIVSIAK